MILLYTCMPPRGMSVQGMRRSSAFAKLRLYSLKQSPCQWFSTLRLYLTSAPLKLRQYPVDDCLFMLMADTVVVLLVGSHV